MIQWIGKHFTIEQIAAFRFFLVLLVVLFYLALFFLFAKRRTGERKEVLKHLVSSTGRRMKKYDSYERKKRYLSSMGVNYMVGREVTPEEYQLIKLTFGFLLGLICIFATGLFGIVGFPLGYYFPDVCVRISNRNDNNKLLFDIKEIFDTLKVKTECGMFLTSAISECYRMVKNRRLKQALYEMTGELVAKSDISATIENFRQKFDNKYIDTLCIILRQSLESGKTVEVLKDVTDQLADMQKAINVKIKSKMDFQIQMMQLLLYTMILALCVYSVMAFIGDLSILL